MSSSRKCTGELFQTRGPAHMHSISNWLKIACKLPQGDSNSNLKATGPTIDP